MISIQINKFQEKGLYLIDSKLSIIDFSENNIKKVADTFWNDYDKIPSTIRDQSDFKKCSHCPLMNIKGFCNALQPVLPFLNIIDQYKSYDKVVAIYKGDEEELISISDTTM